MAGALVLLIGGALVLYKLPTCCAPAPLDIHALLARDSAGDTAPLAADFAVEVESGTGSLAPIYHYDYRLRVEGSGAATLTYWPGYDHDDGRAVRASFTVPDSVVRMMASLARRLRRAPGTRDQSDIPVGGRSAHITLHEGGTRLEAAEWQPNPYARWQDSLQQAARRAIPDSIWTQCEAAQRRYAAQLQP